MVLEEKDSRFIWEERGTEAIRAWAGRRSNWFLPTGVFQAQQARPKKNRTNAKAEDASTGTNTLTNPRHRLARFTGDRGVG